MLPEVISNGLASLQPGKVRYTCSALLEFTAEGLRVDAEFHRAAIRSSKRLTYEQVDGFLADRPAWRRKLGAKVHALLGDMHALAMMLRRRRLKHGALELDMPEVKVDLDASGRVVARGRWPTRRATRSSRSSCWRPTRRSPRRFATRACPSSAASTSRPARPRSRSWAQFVRELGVPAGNLRSRFDLQKLLHEVTGRPEQRAVHFAVLRSLQRAFYSPGGRRPLCPGQRLLLPLHFAHPPLSRPDRPPPAGRAAVRPQAPQPSRRTGRARPALLRLRAAGRSRRTRADETQIAGLPERADRRGNGRRGHGRGGLRAVRRGRRAARPGVDPRRRPERRLLPFRSRHPHAHRPPRGQALSVGRLAAGGRGAGRSGAARVGFPPRRAEETGPARKDELGLRSITRQTRGETGTAAHSAPNESGKNDTRQTVHSAAGFFTPPRRPVRLRILLLVGFFSLLFAAATSLPAFRDYYSLVQTILRDDFA